MTVLKIIIILLVQIKSFTLNNICRIRYELVLRKLRKRVRERKLNVLFLVNEISKWKAQRLYELLEKDEHFSPIIGLTFADIDWELSQDERINKRQALKNFFTSKAMRIVEVCDEINMDVIDLRNIHVDIVFYQQPWRLHKKQKPHILSRYHLTCYFPYYVPNYSLLTTDCQQGFHYLLWKYYHLSYDWVLTISKYVPQCVRSVKLVPTGHPMLDVIRDYSTNETDSQKKVIYAPHWSVYSEHFDNDERYSTFQHNGREILDFAKRHPEIKWYFKPHPTLKASLLRTKLWEENEIEEYYNEWSRIGEVCSGDYVKLFWESSALITDCGSFLVEYPCTKKPVIRLVSSVCGIPTPEPSHALFESFYNVHSLSEMYEVFQLVLVEGLDPKCDERIKAIENAGLLEKNASENIIKDLYMSLALES